MGVGVGVTEIRKTESHRNTPMAILQCNKLQLTVESQKVTIPAAIEFHVRAVKEYTCILHHIQLTCNHILSGRFACVVDAQRSEAYIFDTSFGIGNRTLYCSLDCARREIIHRLFP
jgi:hypothetical protein